MKRDRPSPQSIGAAYDVLGLRAGAERQAVQAAHRRLACAILRAPSTTEGGR